MIAINDYRQFIAELVAAASKLSGVRVDSIRLAVTEQQLVTLLKDLKGVVVCGDIPDATLTYPTGGWRSENECFLFVLEKMVRDRQAQEDEFCRYGRLQQLMAAIVRLLTGEELQEFCDRGQIEHAKPITVEWEYATFGGFNGLSCRFYMRDNRGTGL